MFLLMIGSKSHVSMPTLLKDKHKLSSPLTFKIVPVGTD